MREFRKKQKILNKIMRAFLIFAVLFILIFIGAEPYIADISQVAATVINSFCDVIVIAAMVFLFIYYNRYSKSDSFLENIEYEISDWGFYYSTRTEGSIDELSNGVLKDLKNDGYAVNAKVKIGEIYYKFIAMKKKEFFYCTYVKGVKKDDVKERLNAAINNATVTNLKRKGSLVLLIITDKADESAIEVSKMVVPIGKKDQFQATVAIIEVESKKCYFLGNKIYKCQQMILSYVMKCGSPIDDKLKGARQLECQRELERHMESFDIKDFKNGNFSAH